MARKKRSIAVLVLGILHLIGGVLGLLGGLLNILSLLITSNMSQPSTQGPMNQARIQAMMNDAVPGFQAYQYTEIVAGIFLSVLLIVAGIGLVNQHNYGRTLSLIWAPLSILIRVIGLCSVFFLVIPAMQKVMASDPGFAALPPAQRATFDTIITMSLYGGAIFSIVFLAYPIATLCILLNKKVANSFKPVEEYQEEYPEDEPDPANRRSRREQDFPPREGIHKPIEDRY